MKALLIVFILFISVCAKSQISYELFNSKSELFFNQPDVYAELVGLKADSTKLIGTDSVYYHYRILGNGSSSSCFRSAQAPSWLGYKTIRTANNDYIFFNQQNDSLILKPSLPVNSSWTYFKYNNGDYIKATISLKQYEATFNGLFDTVKTISFQAYNNLNNPISNPYNTIVFKVAKQQGVLKLGNMYGFPVDTTIYQRCGGKRLTIFDLTDHAVGDVLQTYRMDGTYAMFSNSTTKYTTYQYLTKTIPTFNTAVYTRSVTVQIRTDTYNMGALTTTTNTNTYTDTITIDHLDSIAITQMPQQFFDLYGDPGNYGGTGINYYFNPNSNSCVNFRINYGDCMGLVGTSDTCLGPSVSCPEPKYRTLISGMGEYGESIMTQPNNGQPRFESYPIYSNSSNGTCGSTIVLGINNSEANNELKIFPNPAKNYLYVELPTQSVYELKIIDIYGKEILIQDKFSNINVSGLSQGLYFVKIKTDKGEFTQKFVKE